MGSTFLIRFRAGNYALIVQEFMPETGIQKVKGGVLHSSVVPVNRQPVFHSFFACQSLFVLRIGIADVIPGRTSPLRHGIGLTFCRSSAARAGGVDPVCHGSQRRLAVIGRHVALYIRQLQRKGFFRNRNVTAFVAVYDRNRLTPVTLTGEYPVTQLIVCFCFSNVVLFEPLKNFLFCFRNGKSVQETGVDKSSLCNVGVNFVLYVAACNNLDDRHVEFLCELPVTLIVCRYCHDGAGAVAHQYIIGNPDRDLFSINRVDCGKSVDHDTGLVFCKLGTLEIGFSGCHLTVCADLIPVLDLIFVLVDVRMLRGEYHVRNTEQGIRACGIDSQLLRFIFQGEINLCSVGTSDPVFLGSFDTLNIVNAVQTVDQLVCILGDLQHPLALYFADNRASAALAHAVYNFLICKAYLTGSTPVDRHLFFICQSGFEKFQENPLGPVIVFRIRRVDLSVPVEGISKRLKLVFEVMYVVFGNDLRMNVVFDRIVLRWKTKCIPAHRIQNVVTLHSALSGYNVQCSVRTRMAYVKSLS